MSTEKTVVLSSDHAAIAPRQAVAAHLSDAGWKVEDMGPQTPESTDYPKHGRAAAMRGAPLTTVACATQARTGSLLGWVPGASEMTLSEAGSRRMAEARPWE